MYDVDEEALSSPIMVAMASHPKWCVHAASRYANPPLKSPRVEDASSAVTLLCHPCPGGCRLGSPREMGSLFVCKPWGEHPIWQYEARGLNPALSYVPATPTAGGVLPWATFSQNPLLTEFCLRHCNEEPERGSSSVSQNHSCPNLPGQNEGKNQMQEVELPISHLPGSALTAPAELLGIRDQKEVLNAYKLASISNPC